MRRSVLIAHAMILLLLSAAAESEAMSAYARNFDMKCGECHKQRIPELNDFGIAFYKNGFKLPGKDQEKPAPPQGEAIGSASPDPSDTPGKKTAEASGQPDEKGEEKTPVPPPEVPLVIYKGQAGDGSVYFTDNPLSKRLESPERKPRRLVAKAPVVRQPQQKEPALRPERPATPTYRSYQECMERLLENAQAGSTQQMMDSLMNAERACADYR